jgi:hypothetical protein
VLWIPLSFLSEFGFGQLFKVAQRRGCYNPAVVTVNYLVLAGWLALYFFFQGGLDLSPDFVRVGVFTGTVFIAAMLIMTRALARFHVAAVMTAFRMAILVPVFASVLLWGETASPLQWVGIGLAVVALGLMTQAGNWGRFDWVTLAAVLAVLLAQGSSMTCLRWVKYAGLGEDLPRLLLVTGLTAGGWGLLFLMVTRYRPRKKDLGMGALVGSYNLVALNILLTALDLVPGTVFFPLMGCTVVALDNLCAHFVWKERLSRAAFGGVCLALGAIVLAL